MRQIDRVHLVSRIAIHLQTQMNTTQINVFLTGLGIECDEVSIVDSKRAYVERLLKKSSDAQVAHIAAELGIELPASVSPAVHSLKSYLDAGGFSACREDFSRALITVDTDPDSSLAFASATLESVCKAILDRTQTPYPRDQSLQPLVSAVFDVLDLSPAKAADPELKRVLGGLVNTAVGVGVLRTKFSSAHGKGDSQPRLSAHHARLAVNACTAVALFLIETVASTRGNEHEV
jgi:hypothetical protein